MTDTQLEPQIIQAHGPVRGYLEFRLYATLHPCVCGESDVKGFKRRTFGRDNASDLEVFDGTCPNCGRPRRFESWPALDAEPPFKAFHLEGTPCASQVIGPHEFLEIVLRADLSANPDAMDVDTYRSVAPKSNRAREAVNELAKFLRADTDSIPDAAYTGPGWPEAREHHPEGYTRTWIEATTARLAALGDRYQANAERIASLDASRPKPPPPKPRPFTEPSLAAHALWTKKGGKGQGTRLEVSDYDASRAKLSTRALAGLIANRVTFDGADFSFGDLFAAELTDCSLVEAGFSSAKLVGSRLVRSRFDRANLTLTWLGDSELTDCTFDSAYLDRTTWYRSIVRGCSFRGAVFGNASFDKAVFVDCDFRGADFSLLHEELLGTIHDALFERCDFRDTRWARRSLHRSRFIDCKFAGSSGPPVAITDVEVIAPDLSADGTGTPGLTRDDLAEYWDMDMDAVRAADQQTRDYWTKRYLDRGDDPTRPFFATLLAHPDQGKRAEQRIATIKNDRPKFRTSTGALVEADPHNR